MPQGNIVHETVASSLDIYGHTGTSPKVINKEGYWGKERYVQFFSAMSIGKSRIHTGTLTMGIVSGLESKEIHHL